MFASEESDNDKIEIFTTNLETGEASSIEIDKLEDVDVSEAPAFMPGDLTDNYSVIGDDQRMRIPQNLMNRVPYSCIGVIISEFPDGTVTRGTGVLFGPNDVVTAGHVLYDKGYGGVATKVYFAPATNGNLEFQYVGRKLAIPQEYMDTSATEYDYGVFDLGVNVGDTNGYLGWTTEVSQGDYLNITVYPGDKSGYEMWAATGNALSISSGMITYDTDTDTENGESGAPVFYLIGSNKHKFVAIHSGGSEAGQYNSGKRVDESLSNILYSYRNNLI